MKKLRIKIGLLICATLSLPLAHGSEVDTAPLVEYLKNATVTVTSPFKLYHYFSGWGEYKEQFPSDDARGFKYVQYNAAQYLKKFGQVSRSGSSYGIGLYAAVDPITTKVYGKDQNWDLAEIDIPVGFKFIRMDYYAPLPTGAAAVVSGLCGDFSRPVTMGDVFSPITYDDASPTCIEGMRDAITQVRVDAFSYAYFGHPYSMCRRTRQLAFLILSGQSLKPESVRLFNAHTVDNKAGRRRLESLLIRSWILDSHTYDGHSSYPATITSASSLVYGLNGPIGNPPISVHWQDLEGEQADADIDSWMKDNLLGCGDTDSYAK